MWKSGALIRDHNVVTLALLCHKESAPIIGPFPARKPPIPHAIKNQRGAKPRVVGFGCDELVLYGNESRISTIPTNKSAPLCLSQLLPCTATPGTGRNCPRAGGDLRHSQSRGGCWERRILLLGRTVTSVSQCSPLSLVENNPGFALIG